MGMSHVLIQQRNDNSEVGVRMEKFCAMLHVITNIAAHWIFMGGIWNLDYWETIPFALLFVYCDYRNVRLWLLFSRTALVHYHRLMDLLRAVGVLCSRMRR